MNLEKILWEKPETYKTTFSPYFYNVRTLIWFEPKNFVLLEMEETKTFDFRPFWNSHELNLTLKKYFQAAQIYFSLPV